MKAEGILVEAFMKYMSQMTRHIDEKISRTLPDKFVLVHNWWSYIQTHFVSAFVVFPSSKATDYSYCLSGFSPF